MRKNTTQREERKIARVHAETYIKNTNGKFFTAVFRKKDNSRRVLNGRLGVTAYLAGGENKVVRPDNSYMTVFDVKNRGYRTVNLATLEELHMNGKIYKVVD